MDFTGISSQLQTALTTLLPMLAHEGIAIPSNAPPVIDLSVAENFLLRDEMLAFCKDAFATKLGDQPFNYQQGLGGDPALLEALAGFFNTYFHPAVPVQPDHVVATSGAGDALQGIIVSICNDGDSVLVPEPMWDGFHPYFMLQNSVSIIPATSTPFTTALDSSNLITALKTAYTSSTHPSNIKALIFTNPHNPFAQCYPRETIEACMRFCDEKGLHFISDEVYALSTFDGGNDQKKGAPFVSALEVLKANATDDKVKPLIDPSRVHVVWSGSKDFGCSGLRMGCIITQNPTLRLATALTTYYHLSSLTAHTFTALLTSPSLPSLITLNSTRLSTSYKTITTLLKKHHIPYLPANGGLFVFARVAPDATSWEDEEDAAKAFAANGLKVGWGRKYRCPEAEMGWVRILFSVPEGVLAEVVRRMDEVLGGLARVQAIGELDGDGDGKIVEGEKGAAPEESSGSPAALKTNMEEVDAESGSLNSHVTSEPLPVEINDDTDRGMSGDIMPVLAADSLVASAN